MQKALDTHDTVLRALLARYYGYEVTTEGDSFTMSFHDPVDAVHIHAFMFSFQRSIVTAGYIWACTMYYQSVPFLLLNVSLP